MPFTERFKGGKSLGSDLTAVFPHTAEQAVFGDAKTARTPTTGKEIAEDPLGTVEQDRPAGV
jgi:hypothetical protein